MQTSARICRNGFVLVASSLAIAALLDIYNDTERYSLHIPAAIASETPFEMAQTTANELLVEINNLLDEGWQQMKAAQYQSAIASYERAIASAQTIGAQQQVAEALTGIGVVDALLGNHQQAIASYNQAFSVYQSLGQLNSAAAALQEAADSYWTIGDRAQAESHFRQALDLYRQTGDAASEQYVLSLLDRVMSEQ